MVRILKTSFCAMPIRPIIGIEQKLHLVGQVHFIFGQRRDIALDARQPDVAMVFAPIPRPFRNETDRSAHAQQDIAGFGNAIRQPADMPKLGADFAVRANGFPAMIFPEVKGIYRQLAQFGQRPVRDCRPDDRRFPRKA